MRGGIARVEIEVATTFAVSWKPLVKSKTSAVATTMTTMTSASMGTGRLEQAAGSAGSARSRISAHEFLMTMPSRMLATRSVASMASSRRSKMSFQRITTMGSMPVSNSEAIASRVMRSPSFSRRLISTV